MARSRFALYKSRNKWTELQKFRALIIFKIYPEIERAYNLSDGLRKRYN